MKTLAMDYPVQDLCSAFNVSRSGYYAWLKRAQSPRSKANQRLLRNIEAAFLASRKTYGSPRLTHQLRATGLAVGRHRVARLMRSQRLVATQKRRFRPRTTDSRHSHPVAPNHLAQRAPATQPNQVWVTDITYVPTSEGWLYLAAVMDLYSRKIVGWAAAHHLETSLIQQALNQALRSRRPSKGLLHHSDRGVQYASHSYQKLLLDHHLIPSMSRKGNCYDNAAMESFWSTLKTELLDRQPWLTRQAAILAIFDYIEAFYNRRRLHSSLGYKSPLDFENQNN